MKSLPTRQQLAHTYLWQRELISQLQARIRIAEALLRSLREEIAEVRSLEGDSLRFRFQCESLADLQRLFREKREYVRRLEDLWIAGERNLKPREVEGHPKKEEAA